MNTNQQQDVDTRIKNAHGPGDVPADSVGMRDDHEVYWILRGRGFSHFAAVLTTHNLFEGSDGLPQIKNWKDLQKPGVLKSVNGYRDMVERYAKFLESLHSNQDRPTPGGIDELLSALENCIDDISDDSTVPRG